MEDEEVGKCEGGRVDRFDLRLFQVGANLVVV